MRLSQARIVQELNTALQPLMSAPFCLFLPRTTYHDRVVLDTKAKTGDPVLLSDLEEAGVQALEVRNMKLQIVPATEVVVFSKELDHSCEGSQEIGRAHV